MGMYFVNKDNGLSLVWCQAITKCNRYSTKHIYVEFEAKYKNYELYNMDPLFQALIYW